MGLILLVISAGSFLPASAQTGAPAEGRDPLAAARRVTREAGDAVAADRVEEQRAVWNAAIERGASDVLPRLGLAALDTYTHDLDAAEAGYRAILGDEPDLTDPLVLYAALQMAKVVAESRAEEAAEWTRTVVDQARRTGHSTLEAMALTELARQTSEWSDHTAMMPLLDSAEARADPADTLLTIRIKCVRAYGLGRVASHPAQELTEEGIALARAVGSLRSEAVCLAAKAVDLDRRGAYVEIMSLIEELDGIYRQTRDHFKLAGLLQARGQFLSQYGYFGEGMAFTRAGLAAAQEVGNVTTEAWAWIVLAYVTVRLDDPVLAMEYARAAEPLLEELRDLAGLANLMAVRGDAASLAGAYDEAREAYADAAVLARDVLPAGIIHVERRLASLARHSGDLEGAARHLAVADSLALAYEAVDHEVWSQGYEHGLLAMARGDLPAAEGHFRSILENLPQGLEQHQNQIDARARLAEVLALRGDLDAAAAELGAALDKLDEWRDEMGEREFRLAVLHAQNLDWDRDLGIARTIGVLARGGHAETALALSERQRSRVLLDRLVRRGSLTGTFSDSLGPAGDSLPTLPRFDAEALVPALPRGTALVSYVTDSGGDRTTVFVVSALGVSAFDAPPADSLRSDIRRFTALLESGFDGSLLARRLGAALLGSAVEALPPGTERLIVVPDGPLHRLPFDALRLPDDRLVLERFTVTLAPSAAYTASRFADQPGPGRRSVVAFGDPHLPDEGFEGLAHLPGADREVRLVARYADGSRPALGEAASEAAFKAASLAGAGVLHLATHAVVADRSLVRTSLILTPGGGEDGRVQPHELASLDLDVDLVVLSACRTAQGALLTGEGVQGLTAPFLEAGARAVVASYWPLGDESALPLIDDFYAGMADGAPAAAALREAKLASLRRGDDPSLWSSLTLVGDGRVAPALEAPSRRGLWLAAGAAVLLLALAAAPRRRARD